jgi:hypothetical protein
MTVIINDFEVVAEQPAPAEPEEGAAPPQPPVPTPLDIERIIEQHMARLGRVWAG